ncbi:antitoxin component YwqK of YwqJK toxin-antitoxin module [Winogradskyella wandonensis]|uniref:Antitoxin component YwqK of YwqJK toxin-antitoxin module n=1 Tax=Winogradskyella wandonensis TaxID=1442586 RepID=A0A4V2PU45_9FLAO|nr:toxin-antitoxin system YwqK family antitoxin [Winogradskyella wandonensis]TCK68781.1 antitoxin component YwqK of YwqJK toxin-antitoxin module [Winogradskyella wandonensis]
MIKHKFKFLLFFTITLTSLTAQNEINSFDKDGKRHGIWKKTYPNTNQLRYEGQFVHGKEIDTFKYYKLKRKKSVLSAVKVFNSIDNKAEVTFLASNGKIISQGKMAGKDFIGRWLFYHKNSNNVMIEENYNLQGQLDGKRTVFFVRGQIAEEETYKNGLLNGISKIYAESGKLLQESLYKDDKLNGISTYYDADGNIQAKGSFKDNLKVGIWEYYKNGVLTRKVNHDTDKVLYKKQ